MEGIVRNIVVCIFLQKRGKLLKRINFKNYYMDSGKIIQSISILIIAGALVAGAFIVYNIIKISGSSEKTSMPTEQKLPVQTQPRQEVQSQVLQEDAPKPKQSTSLPVDINNVKITGRPYIGQQDAPVTIAYWFDYQCPFCKKMEQNVITQLITDYIEPGTVKLVYKDYQFLGADSQTAGLASRAVWEIAPERFFEWHKAMYENQDGENYAWGSKTDILLLTKSLGIDQIKVGKLMTDKAQIYQSAIDADKAEGKTYGIRGTPGTVIGKKLITGAQSYSVFKSAIDQVLGEQ